MGQPNIIREEWKRNAALRGWSWLLVLFGVPWALFGESALYIGITDYQERSWALAPETVVFAVAGILVELLILAMMIRAWLK